MKAVSGKEFCKILEAKGWELKRVNGSHHIFGKEGRRERPSIPVHKNESLKIGLQKALMKICDIAEDDL